MFRRQRGHVIFLRASVGNLPSVRFRPTRVAWLYRGFALRILLLGGSNAGVRDGWAAQFSALATEHHVENGFLGAVGSLYGLMALMKMARERVAPPDLVILEYCLNDVLLVEAGVLRLSLVIDALRAVADFCARNRVALLFVNLEPRPTGDPRQERLVRRIGKIYALVAAQRNIPSLWLREVFPEGLTIEDFRDQNHLSTEAAERVAKALMDRVAAGALIPSIGGENLDRFSYVDARDARASGPVSLRMLESRVFKGAFLEIERGGGSLWRGRGSLVALMLLSDDRSGVYAIRIDGQTIRKTARSQMQAVVTKLMLLHYVAGDLPVREEVEIAMPGSEADLLAAPSNKGLLEAPATINFEAQALMIHGVIFWTNDYRTRLRDFLLRLL